MAQIKALPADLQKIAIEELGEVPERIPQDLRDFKAWIEQQPHLRARMDDQFLIQFLRGCKYSLEKAKKKIDMFFAMKSKYPDNMGLTDVDDIQIRKLHNTGFYTVLPTPLHGSGPRLVLLRCNYSPHDFSIVDVIRYCEAISEILIMEDPYACINGIVAVVDNSQATANHFMQITINIAKQFVNFHEKAFPMRVKKICFINISKPVRQFINLMLPHLPEKFRKRLIFCGMDIEELDKDIPRKYLPIEYGGENGSVKQWPIENEKIWEENREFFKENENFGTDEKLRIGQPLNFDADLGISGSFRKLDVD
uniref:CRAL-TRIO domain-containing protein n=1 Tax=Stomoxys calcitrans TaxID=35570 RepID=A0A1I8P793_STOCA